MQSMRNVVSIYGTLCSESYTTVFRARKSTNHNSVGSEFFIDVVVMGKYEIEIRIVKSNLHKYLEKNIAFRLKSKFFVFSTSCI